MLRMCLSNIIQKNKVHDLTHAWKEVLGRGNENEEIF